MTSTANPTLPPGTRLAHYEVRREIGAGAMGTVYEAHDTSLDRPVALKVLKPQIASDEAIVERFFREARAAARVNHPNLIHVYFVGREEGRPFFAMELVQGETLEAAVTRGGPFSLADAVDEIVEAARGLAAAHAAGVIHRDVKPSNLIRGMDGVTRVGDFGLAKSMDVDVRATGGGLMGTPAFMSPEQFRETAVDHRSDVYALGLVAWFLLVGRPPFSTQSIGQLLHDQMHAPLPSACAERRDLPHAVDEVLAKLCEKDPSKRPQTMNDAIALLETLRPRPLVLAPLFTRGAAFLADTFLGMLVLLVVTMLLAGAAHLLSPIQNDLVDAVGDVIENVLLPTLPLAAFAGIALLSELWYGTSIGKFLFGLRVVRPDGTRPRALPVVGRLVLRYPLLVSLPIALVLDLDDGVAGLSATGLQMLALLVGVVCYFAKGERTLSDLVTRTRVAYRPVPDR